MNYESYIIVKDIASLTIDGGLDDFRYSIITRSSEFFHR